MVGTVQIDISISIKPLMKFRFCQYFTQVRMRCNGKLTKLCCHLLSIKDLKRIAYTKSKAWEVMSASNVMIRCDTLLNLMNDLSSLIGAPSFKIVALGLRGLIDHKLLCVS